MTETNEVDLKTALCSLSDQQLDARMFPLIQGLKKPADK